MLQPYYVPSQPPMLTFSPLAVVVWIICGFLWPLAGDQAVGAKHDEDLCKEYAKFTESAGILLERLQEIRVQDPEPEVWDAKEIAEASERSCWRSKPRKIHWEFGEFIMCQFWSHAVKGWQTHSTTNPFHIFWKVLSSAHTLLYIRDTSFWRNLAKALNLGKSLQS